MSKSRVWSRSQIGIALRQLSWLSGWLTRWFAARRLALANQPCKVLFPAPWQDIEVLPL